MSLLTENKKKTYKRAVVWNVTKLFLNIFVKKSFIGRKYEFNIYPVCLEHRNQPVE